VDYVRVYDYTAPMKISVVRSNTSWLLTWPANIVCHLQAQTNVPGLGTNWVNVPGATNPYLVPSVPVSQASFFRLQSP